MTRNYLVRIYNFIFPYYSLTITTIEVLNENSPKNSYGKIGNKQSCDEISFSRPITN